MWLRNFKTENLNPSSIMRFHSVFFNALIISVLSACTSFEEEKIKIFENYRELIQTARSTIPKKASEEGLIVKRIDGGILPIEVLLNQYDPTKLMIEMTKMIPTDNPTMNTDLLFLLIFWYSYDTNEHLIFSKNGIRVILKTLKLYKFPNRIVKTMTLNFKSFILEKLASFSHADQALGFLEVASNFCHPFLHKFCFCLEQEDTRNFKENTEAVFKLLNEILDIGPFPLLFNELTNFHEAIRSGKPGSNPKLIHIICYIKLKYRNSLELLEWLNIKPNFQVFYFFFLQMFELQNVDADLKKFLRNSFIAQRRVSMEKFLEMFGDFFAVSPKGKAYTLHIKEGTEDSVKSMIERIFEIINLIDIK